MRSLAVGTDDQFLRIRSTPQEAEGADAMQLLRTREGVKAIRTLCIPRDILLI